MQEKLVALLVYVPKTLRKELKVRALNDDQTLNAVVVDALSKSLLNGDS